VHEFRADCAAINAPRFFGRLSGQPFQVGLRKWTEESQRIKIGFVEAPAAKSVKDALALLRSSPGGTGARQVFFSGLLWLSGSFCSSVVLLPMKSFLQTSILPQNRAPRRSRQPWILQSVDTNPGQRVDLVAGSLSQ